MIEIISESTMGQELVIKGFLYVVPDVIIEPEPESEPPQPDPEPIPGS